MYSQSGAPEGMKSQDLITHPFFGTRKTCQSFSWICGLKHNLDAVYKFSKYNTRMQPQDDISVLFEKFD